MDRFASELTPKQSEPKAEARTRAVSSSERQPDSRTSPDLRVSAGQATNSRPEGLERNAGREEPATGNWSRAEQKQSSSGNDLLSSSIAAGAAAIGGQTAGGLNFAAETVESIPGLMTMNSLVMGPGAMVTGWLVKPYVSAAGEYLQGLAGDVLDQASQENETAARIGSGMGYFGAVAAGAVLGGGEESAAATGGRELEASVSKLVVSAGDETGSVLGSAVRAVGRVLRRRECKIERMGKPLDPRVRGAGLSEIEAGDFLEEHYRTGDWEPQRVILDGNEIRKSGRNNPGGSTVPDWRSKLKHVFVENKAKPQYGFSRLEIRKILKQAGGRFKNMPGEENWLFVDHRGARLSERSAEQLLREYHAELGDFYKKVFLFTESVVMKAE